MPREPAAGIFRDTDEIGLDVNRGDAGRRRGVDGVEHVLGQQRVPDAGERQADVVGLGQLPQKRRDALGAQRFALDRSVVPGPEDRPRRAGRVQFQHHLARQAVDPPTDVTRRTIASASLEISSPLRLTVARFDPLDLPAGW